MKCHNVRNLLIDYSNNELSIDEHTLIHEHLNNCKACQQELLVLQQLENRIRRYVHATADHADPGRVSPLGRSFPDHERLTGPIEKIRETDTSLMKEGSVRPRSVFVHLVWIFRPKYAHVVPGGHLHIG